eukprot:CAMPEP_0202892390 /NCGR_PEP_ID=MMETSP1392-20130828/2114_1 /ASSEMBLY_ACC=CAM_ASM_000868 /TAXON_ID=225041 /ORGANISM="Chlamydomonas chlamydogama, Strain SAG 11-48b" /LENGTH=64 /DNA_ID=CAMNT_0049576321 /DNA_START=57 /DNA_END=251 /DNA_ORIENTATION=+
MAWTAEPWQPNPTLVGGVNANRAVQRRAFEMDGSRCFEAGVCVPTESRRAVLAAWQGIREEEGT